MGVNRSTKSGSPARLLVAETHRSADQLYFGRFNAPDPFIAIQHGRRKIALLNVLEFGRGLKESAFDEVLPLEEWTARARRRFPTGPVGFAEVIFTLAQNLEIDAFSVPDDFPAALAFRLQKLGLAIEPVEGSFFPARETKTDEEVRAIREGNRCSAAGLAAAEDVLRHATVRRGRLYHDGKLLTSERVREAIQIACLRQGGIAMNTIVAGGDQACDPHCEGNGPLRAGELIIVDIFPRISRTGYFGDMTRTFIKGQPSDAQARLVQTVRSAQKLALTGVRSGVSGKGLHASVTDFFTEAGFETKRGPEGSVGFFHGTGHGLGLEVHEAPRINGTGTRLRKGTVVTIEPGLYYPGLGGCRIEDVVQVTAEKPKMLSKFHYEWVLPGKK